MKLSGVLSVIFLPFIFISTCLGQQLEFKENAKNEVQIRLYGHIDYNQKIEADTRHIGKLDVHRLVTLFGYQFNKDIQFVTEIEFEHVKEVFVEQAFLKYRLKKNTFLKAGLILVPMGYVNLQHEPTFFYTVERPLSDKQIIPSTWREIGLGLTGTVPNLDLKYQLFAVNNVLSYDEGPKFSAASGIRSGRQKGAESVISGLPALTGQIEYYGVENLKLNFSAYHGATNTTLHNGQSDLTAGQKAAIDSTTVGLSMLALHSSYKFGKLNFRSQYVASLFSRIDAYNQFSGSDIPNAMHGFYGLVGYNFLKDDSKRLIGFLRFESLNNQLVFNEDLTPENEALKKSIVSFGLNYVPAKGVVYKMDFQLVNQGDDTNHQLFNAGIGVWF